MPTTHPRRSGQSLLLTRPSEDEPSVALRFSTTYRLPGKHSVGILNTKPRVRGQLSPQAPAMVQSLTTRPDLTAGLVMAPGVITVSPAALPRGVFPPGVLAASVAGSEVVAAAFDEVTTKDQ